MNKKEFFIIIVVTFITICAWVIFDTLHKRSEVEIPPKLQEVIEPIDPNLDLESLKQ